METPEDAENAACNGLADCSKSILLDLPWEILVIILELVASEAPSADLIPFDDKKSLSVESFSSEPPQVPNDWHATGTLRLASKRFESWALSRQFVRKSIRFSPEGFNQLRDLIQSRSNIAKHVKKFSYMVPTFSSLDQAKFAQLLNETHATTSDLRRQLDQRQNAPLVPQGDRLRPTNSDLRNMHSRSIDKEKMIVKMMERTDGQRQIIERGVDRELLLSALRVFTGLTQIRLMRVLENGVDHEWTIFCRDLGIDSERLSSRWIRACGYASRTLGQAFLESHTFLDPQSPPIRISCRSLDPQTPLLLTQSQRTTVADVAVRLNCLELQFDNVPDLEEDLLKLALLFHVGFSAAINIEGLHVGFPRPVSIPFRRVFHNLHWKKLKYIGFGPWRLDSEDIIDFVHRHKRTLQAIRLRGVLLNEGSRWVDILRMLRLDLLNLKWVSLRRVGYSEDEELGGMHIQDDDDEDEDSDGSNWGVGDGEVDADDEEDEDDEAGQDDTERHSENAGEDDYDDESGGSSHESVAGDSELGTAVNDLAIDDETMVHHSTAPSDEMAEDETNNSSSNKAQCKCNDGYAWGDLVDDGSLRVPKVEWKWWEKWIEHRCRIHDPRESS